MNRAFELSSNLIMLCGALKEKTITIPIDITPLLNEEFLSSKIVFVEVNKILLTVRIMLSESDSGSYIFDLGEGSSKFFYNSAIRDGSLIFIMESAVEQLHSKHKLLTAPEIYKITNKITGKIYVGKTLGESSLRWMSHAKGYGNKGIYKDITEIGIENFLFEIIEKVRVPFDVICSVEINKYVLARERYYIELYDSLNNGYNEQ